MTIDATIFGQPEVAPAPRALRINTVMQAAAPSSEPLSLQQAKDHLHVVIPDEDDYIADLITAARQMAEGALNRTLVQRSLTARFTTSDARYWLRKPPIVSVDSVTAIDSAYVETPLDTTMYAAIATDDSTEIRASVPNGGALEVTYTAGYPAGEVPRPITQWMRLAIGTMYANRETMSAGVQIYDMPQDFTRGLLQPYMVYE